MFGTKIPNLAACILVSYATVRLVESADLKLLSRIQLPSGKNDPGWTGIGFLTMENNRENTVQVFLSYYSPKVVMQHYSPCQHWMLIRPHLFAKPFLLPVHYKSTFGCVSIKPPPDELTHTISHATVRG